MQRSMELSQLKVRSEALRMANQFALSQAEQENIGYAYQSK